MDRRRLFTSLLIVLSASWVRVGLAEDRPLSFGVISQRSPILTAEYWNPILHHVSERSGVPLQLKLAKTGPDHAAMVRRGEFDFLYSNHNFTVENSAVGYKVIARPREAGIRGEVVVLADSPARTLGDLADKDVVFPSKVAFVGYFVPMDALLRAGIRVNPLFAGTQEGAMGQLQAGRAAGAAVNSQVMRDFAAREGVQYRVLWQSDEYLNIPVSVHPSVPADKVKAVRDALLGMADDPEGRKVLAASAEVIKQKPPFGFVAATDAQYENVRRFYQESLVKED